MTSKKALLTLAVLLVSGTIFAQRVQLKIASMAPARSPWDVEQKALAQEWSKITGGKVSITFYDSLALGGEKAVIQKIRSARPGQKALLDGLSSPPLAFTSLRPKQTSTPFRSPSSYGINASLTSS
jgi:TRAP-type C4-dicarboxylate transport system substrate-binding protein